MAIASLVLRVLILALVLSVGSASAQTTWYVDANATPPGNGSASQPYTSLVYAMQQASSQSGDTFLVAPGAYAPPPSSLPYLFLSKLTIRGTAGAAVTRITGTILVTDSSTLEGFTVEGTVSMGLVAKLRRCVVFCPTGDCKVDGKRAVFVDDYATIEHCVLAGYDLGIQMFAFATKTAQIRNTIILDVNKVINFGAFAHFDHCALPWIVNGPPDITATGTVVGDPGVWDSLHHDYHLRLGSPCIDAGIGNDPDGTPADIGTFPYDPSYCPEPVSYCTSKVNSAGCTPSIRSTGLPSASAGSGFVITTIREVENKFGKHYYSTTGANNSPFQGGFLCLQPPLVRTPVQNSGGTSPCGGVYMIDFNAYIASGKDPSLVPGQQVWVQTWSRDPASPSATNLSDAITFTICP
jgi:hypothetical protein